MGGGNPDAGRCRVVGFALGVGPFALDSVVRRCALNTDNSGLTSRSTRTLLGGPAARPSSRRLAWFVRPSAGPHTPGELMFDHVKFGVSDYAASRAFFLKALEPLGIAVVSEGPPTYGVELSSKGKA